MSPPAVELFKSLRWMELRTSENSHLSNTQYQNPVTYSDLNSTNHKDKKIVKDAFLERTIHVWPNSKENTKRLAPLVTMHINVIIKMLLSASFINARFDNYKKCIYRHCNTAILHS
jgi:hypothetical protein